MNEQESVASASLPELEPLVEGSPQLRRLTLGAVALLTLLGTIGTALSPWLLTHAPVALVALSPDVRHLVLVAAKVDFVPVALAAEVRRAAGLIAMYGIGWFYGPRAIAWFEAQAPSVGGLLRRLERWFARIGWPLLIVFPVYTLGAFAGAARTKWRAFLPAMLLGQFLYIAAAYYFGDAIQDWTKPLLEWLAKYVIEATATCVAGVAGYQVYRRWNRRG